ncbi:MAG: glycosyltransferase, partial [Gaiellaceae bacterium]
MIQGKRIAVVVPAYDEERLVGESLGSVPAFVDRIFVVDDASTDATAERVRGFPDDRVRLIEHERNLGVWAAIVSGYKAALAE